MYRIITHNGDELTITEHVNYIKVADNGCYVLTEKAEAEGVAVDGTPYSLIGHEPIKGGEDTVVVSEFDGAKMLTEKIAVIEDAAIHLEMIAVEHGDMTIEDVPEEWQGYFMTDDDAVDVGDGNGDDADDDTDDDDGNTGDTVDEGDGSIVGTDD